MVVHIYNGDIISSNLPKTSEISLVHCTHHACICNYVLFFLCNRYNTLILKNVLDWSTYYRKSGTNNISIQ